MEHNELIQVYMILKWINTCAFEFEKNQQTIPKNLSRYKKKLGMLNIIKQLHHFVLCNMMCNNCIILYAILWIHVFYVSHENQCAYFAVIVLNIHTYITMSRFLMAALQYVKVISNNGYKSNLTAEEETKDNI